MLSVAHSHLPRLAVTVFIGHTLVRIRAGPNAISARVEIRSHVIVQQRLSPARAILGRRIRLSEELTHDIQMRLSGIVDKAIPRASQRLEARHAQVLDRGGRRVEIEIRAEVVVDGIPVRAGVHGAGIGEVAALVDEPVLGCRIAHREGRGGGVDFFDGDVGRYDNGR